MDDRSDVRYFSAVEMTAEWVAEHDAEIVGYAATFDTFSKDLGGFREVFNPGSFNGTLGGSCAFILNDDPSKDLGRTNDNSLHVRGDRHGFAFKIRGELNEHKLTLLDAIDRRLSLTCAVRLTVNHDVWASEHDGRNFGDGKPIRCIEDAVISSVSVLILPPTLTLPDPILSEKTKQALAAAQARWANPGAQRRRASKQAPTG